MADEYDFTIGFQNLTGLPEEGVYGVSWRKGDSTGRSEQLQSSGCEVDLNYSADVTQLREEAVASQPKKLFEVYVTRFEADGSKTTLGMLYINLLLHIPKHDKTNSKQIACLQLSNCTHPSVRLRLTVQCTLNPQHTVPHNSVQVSKVKELTDEVRRLKRENDRLKEEESYTYTNQPQVRPSVKALESQIERLKEELGIAKKKAEESVVQHQEKLEEVREAAAQERERVRQAGEVKEIRLKADLQDLRDRFAALENQRDDDVARVRDEMNHSFRTTVENNIVKGESCRSELDGLHNEVVTVRKENDTLRKQLKQQQSNYDQMHGLYEDSVKEAREMRLNCDALESQKTCLSQRLEQMITDHKELVSRSQDENSATEEAKQMLSELMGRVQEAQKTEEALQSALSVCDEEKGAAIIEQTRLRSQVSALQEALRTARQEEKSIAHANFEALSRELDTHKVETMKVQRETTLSLEKVTKERDEAATVVTHQAAQITQKKRRITDLKKILTLHLKLKEAQIMASTDAVAFDMLISSQDQSCVNKGIYIDAP